MSISQNYPIVSPSLSLDFANTKVLDPRITFSRPTDAVYYDGKTVTKAEENLFLYSQEFDNANWRTFATGTKTPNATTAPDGTLTADELTVVSTTNNVLYSADFASANGTYSGSFYLKPSTGSQWVLFALTRGDSIVNGVRVWVDLINGVIGTSDALNSGRTGATLLSASVEVSTNGFYRVLLSGNFSETNLFGATQISLVDADASTDFTNQDGNSIFLWGAQLEARDTVTAYTPTTTQAITNYIPTLLTAPANTARFDHNPVTGESLGLLVEEQRTNLLTYSEEFDNAAWAKSNSTITANTIVAPDGTLTGDKLVENTANSSHFVISGNISVLANNYYTFSFYSKNGERSFLQVNFSNLTLSGNIWDIDLTANTITLNQAGAGWSNVTGSITNVGNGWKRITVSGQVGATINSVGADIRLCSASSVNSYAGDGYSGIYIWGAQLEAGTFPTSYIKTEASQVTRSADSASMTGTNFSDWYRADEGSVYVEANSNKPLNNFLSLVDIGVGNVTTNRNTIAISNNAISAASVTNNVAGLTVATVNTRTAGVAFKGAYSAKDNSMLACLNGGVVATDISGSFLKTVDNMKLGVRNDFGIPLNGWISKVSYYPNALTATQLQALTS
jgi:hypothetical protein